MRKVFLLFKERMKLVEDFLFSTTNGMYRTLDGRLCAHTLNGRHWLLVHYVVLDVKSIL